MANPTPKDGAHLLLRLITLAGFQENPFWIGADLVCRRFVLLKRLARGGFAQERVMISSEVPVETGADWLHNRLSRVLGDVVFGVHCLYSKPFSRLLVDSDVLVACVLRDPCSIAVSQLDYLKRIPRHFFHRHYMALADDNERLKVSILGDRLGSYTLRSLVARYCAPRLDVARYRTGGAIRGFGWGGRRRLRRATAGSNRGDSAVSRTRR